MDKTCFFPCRFEFYEQYILPTVWSFWELITFLLLLTVHNKIARNRSKLRFSIDYRSSYDVDVDVIVAYFELNRYYCILLINEIVWI